MDWLDTTILAFTQPSAEGQPNALLSFLPFVLIFVIFYVLLIAPARKREKKRVEMIDGLKSGDRVITNGGIHGTVVGIGNGVVQIRVADQVKIDVSKNAIAAMQNPGE